MATETLTTKKYIYRHNKINTIAHDSTLGSHEIKRSVWILRHIVKNWIYKCDHIFSTFEMHHYFTATVVNALVTVCLWFQCRNAVNSFLCFALTDCLISFIDLNVLS